MLSDILSMLNRLEATIAVFVFRQLDPIYFACRQYMRDVQIEKITQWISYLFKTPLVQ